MTTPLTREKDPKRYRRRHPWQYPSLTTYRYDFLNVSPARRNRSIKERFVQTAINIQDREMPDTSKPRALSITDSYSRVDDDWGSRNLEDGFSQILRSPPQKQDERWQKRRRDSEGNEEHEKLKTEKPECTLCTVCSTTTHVRPRTSLNVNPSTNQNTSKLPPPTFGREIAHWL